MSLVIPDRNGLMTNAEDCFDCPYIVGPQRDSRNRSEYYLCAKTARLVTQYDKNAKGMERSRPFEEMHGGRDFPAFCPYLLPPAERATGMEEMEEKKQRFARMYTANFTDPNTKQETDFVDIFE
jgi:hypothetical protein